MLFKKGKGRFTCHDSKYAEPTELEGVNSVMFLFILEYLAGSGPVRNKRFPNSIRAQIIKESICHS